MNLDSYLPQPYVFTAGRWTFTSPVPSARVGKLLVAYQSIQQEQGRRAREGEPLLDTIDVDGWPDTTEGLARMMLGDTEVDRLIADDVPDLYLMQVATCAVIYWANEDGQRYAVVDPDTKKTVMKSTGEQAVQLYMDAIIGRQSIREERAAGPKGRSRSGSGRRTASATPSRKAKAAPPSTPTTGSPKA